MREVERLAEKARQAADGDWGVLSSGEVLASALILNRPDILHKQGYTIAEAIARVGPEWVALIPEAARVLEKTDAVVREASEKASDEVAVASLGEGGREIHVNAKLVTYGNAPGYRSVDLTFDISPLQSKTVRRLNLYIDAEDSESIAQHILEVHRFVWQKRDGGRRDRPIDAKPGEQRPRWIGDE